MSKIEVKPFDITEYLDSEEAISEYLSQVLANGDSDEFIRAIGHIARARSMTDIAQKTGLGRENLYNALKSGSKPRFETVAKVIYALGLNISITP
ncbi:addiction module antidote protein [Conservatibacter flavescens]|uniref:Putative addiction module antidote protein n=1 Tax=Conservatibacter flavescens TaxID=28161 RepID=A0A2M8S3K9_9PAST|nr:addiction module antidote protein [Conservatibacter flavescens]PJG85720.1 putative addiction module antidote protein [Conservatibacter flavescens]